MLVAVWLITASVWLGYEIARFLAPAVWDQFLMLAAGIPIGFVVSTWLFLPMRTISHARIPIAIMIGSAIMLLSAILRVLTRKKSRIRVVHWEFWVVMIGVIILYIRLVDRSYLKDAKSSAGTSYSDLPFHMSLIASLSYGANSGGGTLQTPFYLGERLCYPIIPDAHSAIFVRYCQAPLRVAIAVPSVLLLISITIAIHSLAQQFTRKRYVPELAIILFLLASGTGWQWLFVKECRKNPNINAVHNLCGGYYTFWIHSLIHYLLPQRSALYSMSLALCITSLLYHLVESKFKERKAAILAGVMMGLLPMVSAHTYIGVGEYAIFLCALTFPYFQPRKWKKQVISWCYYGITAIVISLPQVLWLMRSERNGFMKINPIWRDPTQKAPGFFRLWWLSLGPFCVISIVFVWFVQESRQNKFYLPAMMVWVVSNFVRYQPGAMDNTKVFFAGWYSLACVAVANYVVMIFSYGEVIGKIIVAISIAGSCCGGGFCIYKAATHRFPLYSQDDVALGKWAMMNTDWNAAVLCSGWHSNPFMAIAGRLVTVGYGGWVWSHGLSYAKRKSFVADLVNNRENVSLFESYNIKYALSKTDDGKRSYNFTQPAPDSHWMLVVDIGTTQVYRLLKNI